MVPEALGGNYVFVHLNIVDKEFFGVVLWCWDGSSPVPSLWIVLATWVMAWVGEEAVDWHSPCRATTCRFSCVVIVLESR